MNFKEERQHKEACLKYTLIAAEESSHNLRDIFLKQAARLEQEIRALTPYADRQKKSKSGKSKKAR